MGTRKQELMFSSEDISILVSHPDLSGCKRAWNKKRFLSSCSAPEGAIQTGLNVGYTGLNLGLNGHKAGIIRGYQQNRPLK
jgi:hypothetical protein